jgi:glycosyltransferase involved in cell wall biosynthesis
METVIIDKYAVIEVANPTYPINTDDSTDAVDTAKDIIVMIPAYNPDERLVQLVGEIDALFAPGFVIVDDWSDAGKASIFRQLETKGCKVIHHTYNRGKGAALKTAILYITDPHDSSDASAHTPGHLIGCITADDDFQHTPEDIRRVAAALVEHPDSLILGVRNFDGKDIPKKSKWGNRITSAVFSLQTGIRGLDTQTGLRGIPVKYLPDSARIEGERYDYEMNMLLSMAKKGVPFVKVPIQTVYTEQNRNTHFRTVIDSARIYGKIIRFSLSSLVCAGADLAMFFMFRTFIFTDAVTGIMLATVAARVLSGICNFCINRNIVFKNKGSVTRAAAEYGILFVFNMLMSGVLTKALSALGMYEIIAKIIVDTCLFCLSFLVQKSVIFNRKRGSAGNRDKTRSISRK